MEIIFLSLGFTATIGAHSISEEVAVFLLYGFPEDNLCGYFLLLLIVVHVILSDKILRSYCQIDKNITKEEVYIEQPQGFETYNEKTHVCKLEKALYRLNRTPRAWY